jgi:hypothetical protein
MHEGCRMNVCTIINKVDESVIKLDIRAGLRGGGIKYHTEDFSRRSYAVTKVKKILQYDLR